MNLKHLALPSLFTPEIQQAVDFFIQSKPGISVQERQLVYDFFSDISSRMFGQTGGFKRYVLKTLLQYFSDKKERLADTITRLADLRRTSPCSDASILMINDFCRHFSLYKDHYSKGEVPHCDYLLELLSQKQLSQLLHAHLKGYLTQNVSFLESFERLSLASMAFGGSSEWSPLTALARFYYACQEDPGVMFQPITQKRAYTEVLSRASSTTKGLQSAFQGDSVQPASSYPVSDTQAFTHRLKELQFIKCEGRTLFFYDPVKKNHVAMKLSKASETLTGKSVMTADSFTQVSIPRLEKLNRSTSKLTFDLLPEPPHFETTHPLIWEACSNEYIRSVLAQDQLHAKASSIPKTTGFYAIPKLADALPEPLSRALDEAQKKGGFSIATDTVVVMEYVCDEASLSRIRDAGTPQDFMAASLNGLWSHGYLGARNLVSASPGGGHDSIFWMWNFAAGAGAMVNWKGVASFENFAPTAFGISDLKWMMPIQQVVIQGMQDSENMDGKLNANLRNSGNGSLEKYELQLVQHALGDALSCWSLVFGKWLLDHNIFPKLNAQNEFEKQPHGLSINDIANMLQDACKSWLSGYFSPQKLPDDLFNPERCGFSFTRWASQMALFMTKAYVPFMMDDGILPKSTGAFPTDVWIGVPKHRESLLHLSDRTDKFEDIPSIEEVTVRSGCFRPEFGWVTIEFDEASKLINSRVDTYPCVPDNGGYVFLKDPQAGQERVQLRHVLKTEDPTEVRAISITENLGARSARFPIPDMIAALFYLTSQALSTLKKDPPTHA